MSEKRLAPEEHTPASAVQQRLDSDGCTRSCARRKSAIVACKRVAQWASDARNKDVVEERYKLGKGPRSRRSKTRKRCRTYHEIIIQIWNRVWKNQYNYKNKGFAEKTIRHFNGGDSEIKKRVSFQRRRNCVNPRKCQNVQVSSCYDTNNTTFTLNNTTTIKESNSRTSMCDPALHNNSLNRCIFATAEQKTKVGTTIRSIDVAPSDNSRSSKGIEIDSNSISDHFDVLYGCKKCEFSPGGCNFCSESPFVTRAHARWNPEESRDQTIIPEAKIFRPSQKEFEDPIQYISSIMTEASQYGLAHIIPPANWNPPFSLRHGTDGSGIDSFKFPIRKQLTSSLCIRKASKNCRLENENVTRDQAGGFGFQELNQRQTLQSFSTYADWMKSIHFSSPSPCGKGHSSASSHRPLSILPVRYKLDTDPSVEEIEGEFWRIVETGESHVDSLYGQDIDSGEYGSGFPLPDWRQELLQKKLSMTQLDISDSSKKYRTNENHSGGSLSLKPDSCRNNCCTHKPEMNIYKDYAHHPWNINNMPLCSNSVLSYLSGSNLITGVMVPWLYVGSCLSAFCWHIEDHALYSVNYLHMGSPKVWYVVPASATESLEMVMKDALPHLFEDSPDLLFQLVTMLSPTELQKRGIPVYRIVHEARSFVVTMPNCYHSGLNTGFNIAEAVNFAAPEWIPYGTDVIRKYRTARKPVTLSHDSLLVSIILQATSVPKVERLKKQKNRFRSTHKTESALNCNRLSVKRIVLAANDLTVRAKEERDRWFVGIKSLNLNGNALPIIRANNCYKGLDTIGFFDPHSECDCIYCKCDLWLNAVISTSLPGIATCTEHMRILTEEYGCTVDSIVLLCRYQSDDLEDLVRDALNSVNSFPEFEAIYQECSNLMNDAPVIKLLGPLYNSNMKRL